jgi:hypothetical protein
MNWSRLVFSAAFLAGSLSVSGLALGAAVPAPGETRDQTQVSLDYFMDRLGMFGTWLKHPVWGDVWQPDAGPMFRPYFYGYWEYTEEYGWFWVSNEPYGDIVYHYGRWIFDPDDGWLWVPGYVWGPSWVVWREGDSAIGWLPMPPGYADYDQGTGIASYAADGWYGYQTFYGADFVTDTFFDLWVFSGIEDFGRSDRRRYVTDREKLRDHFRHSRDRTGYRNDHDHMVDHSLDYDRLKRETHRPMEPQPARRFMRRGALVTSVSEGREIFRREHEQGRGGGSTAGRGETPPAASGANEIRPRANPSGSEKRRIGRMGIRSNVNGPDDSRNQSTNPPVGEGNAAGAGPAQPELRTRRVRPGTVKVVPGPREAGKLAPTGETARAPAPPSPAGLPSSPEVQRRGAVRGGFARRPDVNANTQQTAPSSGIAPSPFIAQPPRDPARPAQAFRARVPGIIPHTDEIRSGPVNPASPGVVPTPYQSGAASGMPAPTRAFRAPASQRAPLPAAEPAAPIVAAPSPVSPPPSAFRGGPGRQVTPDGSRYRGGNFPPP